MRIELNYQEVMKILFEHYMLKGHNVTDIRMRSSASSDPVFVVYSEGIVREPHKIISPKVWEDAKKDLENHKKNKK